MEDIDFVKGKIRWHMNEKADEMANGLPSWDIYREYVGIVKGLALAESFFREAEERRQKGEDEDGKGLTPVKKTV